MSLEQVAFLAQIISAVAVFASLIFVGLQVKQNTSAVRAASSQAHSVMYHGLTDNLVNNEGFATIWWKGVDRLDDLHEGEIVRFFAFASSIFRFFESSRVQWLRGQLDDEHWHTIEQHAIALLVKPGVQVFWQQRKHWHCPAFQHWVQSLSTCEVKPLYSSSAD